LENSNNLKKMLKIAFEIKNKKGKKNFIYILLFAYLTFYEDI
jgi:hypothetical protein